MVREWRADFGEREREEGRAARRDTGERERLGGCRDMADLPPHEVTDRECAGMYGVRLEGTRVESVGRRPQRMVTTAIQVPAKVGKVPLALCLPLQIPTVCR